MALAGGVTVRVPQRGGYFYTPDRSSRPTGTAGRSTPTRRGRSSGAASASSCCKRLEDALADGDNVRAVILGVGHQQRRQRQGGLHRAELPRAGGGDRAAQALGGRLGRHDRLRRGARHRHDPRRSDRALGADRGVPLRHRSARLLRHRLGQVELRTPVVCGRRRGTDQDRARARARARSRRPFTTRRRIRRSTSPAARST